MLTLILNYIFETLKSCKNKFQVLSFLTINVATKLNFIDHHIDWRWLTDALEIELFRKVALPPRQVAAVRGSYRFLEE